MNGPSSCRPISMTMHHDRYEIIENKDGFGAKRSLVRQKKVRL